MSEWSIVRVVAERNITQRLRSRAFLITTALVCVLIVGLGLLQQVLSDTSTPRFDVAVAGPVPSEFTTTLAAAADAASVEVVATVVPDRAAAEAGVVDGRFDAAIDVGTDELLWSGGTDAQLSGVLDTAWRIARSLDAAGAAGLDPVELAQVLNPAPLASVVLDPVDEVDATGQAVGWLTAVLLFFSITFFGGFILMGVVEEKSSAVVEVPLAVWVAMPTSLLWMLAGFLLYSTLFALAGSAAVWEVVVAAVLLLAATYGMLRFAGRMYARTLLHRGTRLRWGDALRGRLSG